MGVGAGLPTRPFLVSGMPTPSSQPSALQLWSTWPQVLVTLDWSLLWTQGHESLSQACVNPPGGVSCTSMMTLAWTWWPFCLCCLHLGSAEMDL